MLENALEAGKEAVERGPEQLAVLREAGVVDAGAYGLTVIVAGCLAALRGSSAPELEHQLAPAALHRPEHESSSFRYCTNFAVTGAGLDAGSFVPSLEAMGDSVLVVGDERTIRVHLHTDDPERAVAVFDKAGEVSRFDVADMHDQVAERAARLAERTPVSNATCSVVAVASGAGVRRLYEELGVLVVDGGATMNPSTYELLAGMHAAGGDEVLVLPNSPNVILAAERAAELSEKPARVVPTTAPQEGLAALLAFDPRTAPRRMPRRWAARPTRCAWAAWRRPPATMPAGGSPRARPWATPAASWWPGETPSGTLAATLEQLAGGSELVTCLAGAGAPLDRERVEAHVPDGVEVEYHEGGQPAWWWLLCAE